MVLSDRSQIGPIDIYNREGPGTQKSLNGKTGEILCAIFLNSLKREPNGDLLSLTSFHLNATKHVDQCLQCNAMYDIHLSN